MNYRIIYYNNKGLPYKKLQQHVDLEHISVCISISKWNFYKSVFLIRHIFGDLALNAKGEQGVKPFNDEKSPIVLLIIDLGITP